MSPVLGAALLLALVAVGGDAVSPVITEAPAIVICGLFGALIGGGLVAVGKEARLRELEQGTSMRKLIEK